MYRKPKKPVPYGPAPRKRTIRRRKPGSTSKLYFNSDTQAAIVAYQQAQTQAEREKLYTKEISPAFEKLVENLINIHKFSSLHDTFDELKADCVNFLFETIGKFDATRGTNAFSYFNVVAKNWLIIKTKQKLNKIKKNVSLSEPTALSFNEQKSLEEYNTMPAQDVIVDRNNATNDIHDILHEIKSKMKTDQEINCINCIITIFENVDSIDLLNKSAVLLYIREMSGLSPKQLTATMQMIKRMYRTVRQDMNNGR